MKWEPWFAWFPVYTLSGSLVWMTLIMRRWNTNINFRIIDTYDCGDYDGAWEYQKKDDA